MVSALCSSVSCCIGFNEHIFKAIKRITGGKTLQEVSDAIGITRVAMGYYEKGERKPDIEMLSRIADFYKVSADYPIGITDVKTPNIEARAIANSIGLSEESIKQLNKFTTYPQEKVRLAIIDYLLRNIKFTLSLTDNINDYYGK